MKMIIKLMYFLAGMFIIPAAITVFIVLGYAAHRYPFIFIVCPLIFASLMLGFIIANGETA